VPKPYTHGSRRLIEEEQRRRQGDPYGHGVTHGQGVTLREHDDGHVEILDAPPVAEFAPDLLSRMTHWMSVDEAGYLVLAGQAVYRPVRLRAHLSGQLLLVCQRVR
jgi:hypothetical protein